MWFFQSADYVFRWEVFAFLAGIPLVYAFGLLSMNKFDAARRWFWAAAILSWAKLLTWGVTTDMSTIRRIALACFVAAVVAVVLIETLRWVTHEEGAKAGHALAVTPHRKIDSPPLAPVPPLPTSTAPPPRIATPPEASQKHDAVPKTAPRAHAVSTAAPFHWTTELGTSHHPEEAPHAIAVMLYADRAFVRPRVEIECDAPIAYHKVSAGRYGSWVADLPEDGERSNYYAFDLTQPVFAPGVQLLVEFEAIREIHVKTVSVTDLAPPSLQQTNINSPNSVQVQVGGNLNIQVDPHEFVVMNAETAMTLSAALATLKQEFPNHKVRIEQENGPGARHQVAAQLSEFVSTVSLGYFNDGTFGGIYPRWPMTVAYHAADERFAHKFAEAVSCYISGETHFEVDEGRWDEHEIRFFLNGTPTFHADGSVVMKP